MPPAGKGQIRDRTPCTKPTMLMLQRLRVPGHARFCAEAQVSRRRHAPGLCSTDQILGETHFRERPGPSPGGRAAGRRCNASERGLGTMTFHECVRLLAAGHARNVAPPRLGRLPAVDEGYSWSFSIRSNRKAAPMFCLVASSRRKTLSGSLENAQPAKTSGSQELGALLPCLLPVKDDRRRGRLEVEHWIVPLERFQFPWNLKAALSLCIVAFSRREVVSTSLENALGPTRVGKRHTWFDPIDSEISVRPWLGCRVARRREIPRQTMFSSGGDGTNRSGIPSSIISSLPDARRRRLQKKLLGASGKRSSILAARTLLARDHAKGIWKRSRPRAASKESCNSFDLCRAAHPDHAVSRGRKGCARLGKGRASTL
jgi:hypothetical protein